jgi:hypothetical protein
VRLRRVVLLCVVSCFLIFDVSAGSAAAPGGFSSSPGATTATADCSEAAAREVVLRLHLNDPEVADPVGKVLCGSFTGPGSQTMVVSLRGPGNTGLIEWAVFHWAGDAWQLIMKQPAAASITAAGSDIRQTLPIYRPDDARCCPTGGTRTRIWHWNGSRFLAGPWKEATPGTGDRTPTAGKSGYFKTPSTNIVCGYAIYTGSRATKSYVGCRIKSRLKPQPPGTPPGCWSTGDFFLRATGRTTTGRTICPGDDEGDAGVFVFESRARVLAYGKTWSGGGLRCASAATGLTCRNTRGHGFFLSRERWRTF